MKYYQITRIDDIKATGHYPQTTLRKGYNPRKNGHFQVKSNEFPDFAPNLELDIHSKAIPTDYLDFSSSFGMIVISQRMKVILENHDIPKHHFYPIKVYHNNILLNYYWLHFIIYDFWRFLDSQSSYAEHKVFVDPLTTKVIRKIPITSSDQIIKEKSKIMVPNILAIGHIKMKKGYPKYDLYQIGCLSYNTLISESLRNTLIKESITGFETKLFDKFEANL